MAKNEDGVDFEAIVNDKMGVIPEDTTPDEPAEEAPAEEAEALETGAPAEEVAADPETPVVADPPAEDATPDEVDVPVENATPANLSVEDIKKVLDERDAQVKFDADHYKELTATVTTDLYPNGFDIALKDEQGHVIANVEDYKQYIDPTATTEEAERIIMNEQSRLNKEVQQARDFIAEKAELTQNMENSAIKVFDKYKDYFVKNPDMLEKIRMNYRKTLKLMNNTIVEAPLDLEEFYDFSMKPYIDNLAARPVAKPVTPAPAAPIQSPKETVSDERLDLVGAATTGEGLEVEGKPNWEKITKDKMRGRM